MNKKGMSLLTLVITVMTMIVVVSATMMSLNKTDIIQRTETVVNDINLMTMQQMANMAYANVYFDNLTKGERREVTAEEIRTRMIKDGTKEEDLKKYNITVKDGDVFVSVKGAK